ncbi:MAG TPA: hypothetical protein VIW25_08665 [Nitrososphaeraceae archaeon]
MQVRKHMLTGLYSIILPILASYGATDFCASDRWSFEGSILFTVIALAVSIPESIMKIAIIVNANIGIQFSP